MLDRNEKYFIRLAIEVFNHNPEVFRKRTTGEGLSTCSRAIKTLNEKLIGEKKW